MSFLNPDAKSSGYLFSIGEVISKIRDEFPEVTISKIRFLESNGLVTPTRTQSGYRKFSIIDIERLRYILRMQRDHFLPLKVILTHLDAIDRGLEPPAIGDVTPRPPRAALSTDALAQSDSVKAVRLTREELVENADCDDELISELLNFGLLAQDSKGYFDGRDLAIVTSAATLASFGLEPRHLKVIKSSASREVDLFTPLLTAARSGTTPATRAQVEELGLQLSNAILKLHDNLVRDLIDELN
jgi:DNA-binding transcriptional MerR regulator